MPRARRRRLKRQRKKHGIIPRSLILEMGEVVAQGVCAIPTAPLPVVLFGRRSTTPTLSRVDLLALAASARTREERRKYRRMAEIAKK